MINYYDGKITDIMPDSLKTDPLVQAVSFAVSSMVKRIVDNSRRAGIYAVLDELDEEIIDLLAVELRTKYYGELLDIQEKREMVKRTLLWYYKAGTLYTVQELTDFVFQDAKAEEWFTYGAGAYLFRIIVKVISQDISLEKYMQFLKAIYEVKNTRSHLEAVIFKREAEARVRTASAGGIGNIIKVKAQAVKKINAHTEDKPVAALFLEQRISVKANDEIKKNEVYCLKEDGQMIRVFTANGSMVRTE